MERLAEIVSLQSLIRARRTGWRRQPTFELEARLRRLMREQLAAEVEAAQRAAARERRQPGSYQRELELDEQ
ncbi:hypothetical protein [Hansschlegelia zhihuaiae]|uniref:Uncharacterized protein n=1 Tax=Hansschlegelia zhihuaiae TaxID=405005 RepID=A0A4Q0MPI4_9HYPH|nr:hypothetical protein [Hansschlegelia zhihuaiae]RXF75059.1 hypothetical protein EK403_03150 [Hansschlegelia zhihuaiae]